MSDLLGRDWRSSVGTGAAAIGGWRCLNDVLERPPDAQRRVMMVVVVVLVMGTGMVEVLLLRRWGDFCA